MPEWYDDPDELEETESTSSRDGSPKALRAALKKIQTENAELKNQNTQLQASLRKSSISGFFRDKGINPKLAKYVPSDIEPDEANLVKWIEEDGDLFNIKLDNAPQKPAEGSGERGGSEGTQNSAETESGPSIAEQWQQLTNTQNGAMPAGKEADLMTQITSASDLESLQKMIFSHGGGTEYV